MFHSVSYTKDEFLLTTDSDKIDHQALFRLLGESYWAGDRPAEVIVESLRRSLCFSLYHKDTMIGFYRVITDTVTFAYLADVIIEPSYRGKGLGSWMLGHLLNHPDTRHVKRWVLATADAHELYARFGFGPIDSSRFMSRLNPEAYQEYILHNKKEGQDNE